MSPDSRLDESSVKFFYLPSSQVNEILFSRRPSNFPVVKVADVQKNAFLTKYWTEGQFDRDFLSRVIANLAANRVQARSVQQSNTSVKNSQLIQGQFLLEIELTKAYFTASSGASLLLYDYSAKLYGSDRDTPVLSYNSYFAANEKTGPKDAFSAQLVNLLKSKGLLSATEPTVLVQ